MQSHKANKAILLVVELFFFTSSILCSGVFNMQSHEANKSILLVVELFCLPVLDYAGVFNPLTMARRKNDEELWEFFLTQPFNRSVKFFFWSMRRKRTFPVTSLPPSYTHQYEVSNGREKVSCDLYIQYLLQIS